MTKERLELLTDDVLNNLAKKLGVKVKPEWERVKLVQSIVDIMEEEREETESLLNLAISMEAKKYSVTVDEELDLAYDVDEEMSFPERYNETMLHFVLRDNSWGFALLDIKNSLSLKYQNKYGDVTYQLRVIELEDDVYDKDEILDFFDIEIEKFERGRYINLPHEDSFYCVELRIRTSDNDYILKRSQVVKTFRDHVNYSKKSDDKLNDIIKLSGFSAIEDTTAKSRNFNRILPMDSMEDEE